MEANSSGEDLLKVRKPYTITKQRERWTEDEHNRFLQALKLYGRAWQKIEEHVVTKTAVQIRSHAQKFFNKMEKEGVNNKGGKEIEIPPPRPKRKPTCPYPKKGKGVPVNFHPLTVDFSKPKLSSPSSNRETPCTQIDATQEKNIGSDENGSCSETLPLFHEAPCVSSISSLKLEPIDNNTNPKEAETPPLTGPGPSEAQQPSFQIPSPYLPNYPPFPPYLPNKPFVETFSNLLITNLVQNPAVHAAARLAASYWTPPVEAEMETSSLAALAAATVAAASSWWASQGLLPFYPQLSPFQFNDGLVGNNNNTISSGINMGENTEKDDGAVQNDSDENMKINAVSNEVNEINNNNNNNNNKKKQDPSSCGSNTPSTSDVETDNIPENQQKGPICDNEKTEGAFGNNNNNNDNNIIINSDNLRRGRSNYISSFNESWKEVSEEGRVAFQALFKRGVLPQSFSPPKNNKFNNAEERESAVAKLAVDLNTCADVINPFASIQGMDLYGKLKARKTGFKPYKRCSIEASENRGTAGEESPAGNKRIRLEGEASI